VWTHGDLVEFAPDGSARMHGRSDGVLNVNGVRIGPSEIYAALHEVAEITGAMAVEQRDPSTPGRTRMVLLVVLQPGAALDGELERRIRRALRHNASPAHVPSLTLAVPELPVTHNGKASERAARDAVNGDVVANEAALRNPGCLAVIRSAVERAAGSGERARGPEPSTVVPPPLAGVSVPEPLAKIWREVLGTADARPDDDFMDLGGSSRQVMSLLRRVKLDLGVDVQVLTFYADPTLQGLARTIEQSPRGETTGVQLLRPGTGRPVFLACDAWGQLNELQALVVALETDRPVYGVQPALSDGDGRRRSIAELADDTTEQLLAVQPEGPHSLVGYSFGGLLVYEVACRLRAAGHRVAFLGLVDALPPTASMTAREAVARRWAGRWDTLRSSARLTEQLRLRLAGEHADPEEAAWLRSSTTYNAHRLTPYDGAVTYFQAARRLPVVGNTLAAWQRAAPHLLVTEIPADHNSVLAHPHVLELARRLSATLA
jgi:acetoacetyl-CoA synthetase